MTRCKELGECPRSEESRGKGEVGARDAEAWDQKEAKLWPTRVIRIGRDMEWMGCLGSLDICMLQETKDKKTEREMF